VEIYYNSKGEINLEWDVQQTYMGVMVRGAHTFGCIV